MAVRSTAVRQEYLHHDTGHWCNQCRLATGFRIWIAVVYLGRMHLQVRGWCSECEGTDVTVDPDLPIG